jgi:hypothetical protein
MSQALWALTFLALAATVVAYLLGPRTSSRGLPGGWSPLAEFFLMAFVGVGIASFGVDSGAGIGFTIALVGVLIVAWGFKDVVRSRRPAESAAAPGKRPKRSGRRR